MRWTDVLNDPSLQNLPYKIELNEYGQIVMSPASNKHGLIQAKIVRFLGRKLRGGEPMTECAIDTVRGVKVADVVWASRRFLKQHGLETPYQTAPELCVEIVSPSNSAQEMEEKRTLYFARGAKEVWIVAEDGMVSIFDPQGQLAQTGLGPFPVPDFAV